MITTLAYQEDWKERRILGNEAYEWGEMRVTAKLSNGHEATQAVFAIRVLRRKQDGSWKFARAIITPGPPLD
jgi:ketosteroid isomerase-like protein